MVRQFAVNFEVVSAPTGAGKWSTWFYASGRLVGRELQETLRTVLFELAILAMPGPQLDRWTTLWKMLFSTISCMYQGSLVKGVFSRCGVIVLSRWLPGSNRSLGLDWIFAQAAFAFLDRWVKLLQAIWPHQKAQAIVVCVHVIHQKGLSTCSPFCLKDDLWTAAWHHQTNTTVYIIRRVYYPHMYLCVMHTYDYSYIYICPYIYIYTHLMFYQSSSSLLWTLAGMAAKVSKAPVEMFSTTFADRVGTLDNSTISTVGWLKNWFVAIRWRELSWLASLPTYH